MKRKLVIMGTVLLLGEMMIGCETTSPATAPDWSWMLGASVSTINALYFSDPARGMTVGDNSSVQFWDGQIWTSQTLTPLVNLHALSLLGNEAWAVGDGGHIFHMSDANFWSPVYSPTDLDLYAVITDADGKGWAVGRNGVILELVQGNWQMASSPTTATLRALARDSDGFFWAVGDGVALICVDDTWQVDSSFPNNCLATAIDISTENMMAVGFGGVMLENDGEGWYQIESGTGDTLWSISRDSDGNGWAVGELGRAIRIGADGSRRSMRLTISPSSSIALYAVFTLSVDEAWVGADDGVIYRYN